MKGWVHPAVRRGTIYWTAQVIGLAGLTVVLILLALQNPTVERLLWAAAFVIATVLSGFFTRKQTRSLRHEYRYEEDDNAADET